MGSLKADRGVPRRPVYLSYAHKHWTHEGEILPVGIILCSSADTALDWSPRNTLPKKVMAREPERGGD